MVELRLLSSVDGAEMPSAKHGISGSMGAAEQLSGGAAWQRQAAERAVTGVVGVLPICGTVARCSDVACWWHTCTQLGWLAARAPSPHV